MGGWEGSMGMLCVGFGQSGEGGGRVNEGGWGVKDYTDLCHVWVIYVAFSSRKFLLPSSGYECI